MYIHESWYYFIALFTWLGLGALVVFFAEVKNATNMTKAILYTLGIVIVIVAIIAPLCIGIGKLEKQDCYEWQHLNATVYNYTVAPWQVAQCEYYNIEI